MLFSFKKCSKIGPYVPKILENDLLENPLIRRIRGEMLTNCGVTVNEN